MRLKSLHISGFKSFCHPVKIEFLKQGVTVIVGPNGCGKSNVVDAIVWVLGEQSAKHLRGGGMEDVIFAGSAFQKPVGVAEVTLTFTNAEGGGMRQYREFSEIAVSRKLYRSGESVYMINKVPVRLMDVRELFMDTGIGSKSYAIIEQGKVGEIVGARPLDRRFLIEDAAGIVKFKNKRLTAERRLQSTQQNLLRVEDLLQELHRQEENLSDQVEKANFFLELKEQSQLIDQQLSSLKWQNAMRQEKTAESATDQHKERQSMLLEKRGNEEAQLETMTADLGLQTAQLDRFREEGFQKEKEIQENESKRTLEQQNLRNSEEWVRQHTRELEELRGKVSDLQVQLETTRQETSSQENQHGDLQAEVNRIEASRVEESDILFTLNDEVQEFQKRLLAIHTQLTNHTNQKGFLEDRLSNLNERQLRLQEQIQANQLQLQQAESKVGQTQEKISRVEAIQKGIHQRLEQFEAELSLQEEQLLLNENRHQKKLSEYQTTQSHLESLTIIQNQYEDFDESVKSFLDLLNRSPEDKKRLGILGVLAEFLTMDPPLIAKIGPALTEYLDLLLVEKTENLAAIEQFCRENDVGRLGFCALDGPLQNFRGSLPPEAVPLTDFVQFSEPAETFSQGFLSQIYIVENEQNWRTLTKNEKFVEWISPQGTYYTRQGTAKIGRPRKNSFGFLERKTQIEELQASSIRLKKDVDSLQEEQSVLKIQQQQQVLKIEAEKGLQHEGELELSRFHKELEHDQLEHRRAGQVGVQLGTDRDQLRKDLERCRHNLDEIEARFLELGAERQHLETQMEQHQESIRVQQRNLEDISETLLSTRVSLTEVFEQLKTGQERDQRLEHEMAEGRKRLRVLENSQEEIAGKIEKSRQLIDDIDQNFDSMLMQRERLKEQLEAQTRSVQEITEKRSRASIGLQEMAKELDQLMTNIHAESLRTSEQRMQREQIEQQMINTYGRSPEEMLEDLDLTGLRENQLSSRFKKLKAQMSEMPNVNLAAPEEYAALQERIEFLSRQSADLQKAVNDLRQSIREINQESRRRFQEAFDLINKHFKELFNSLFEGGEASMILTDTEDVLEAGVDIIAQPPGKKLQNLNLLSGGEKALTAISLIFAIFLIKPSPFCLLDEVDAPLDDVNVGRFNGLIRQMVENTQFIVITHNKKTMEIGSRLYGVTMEEPGISKTVSVQFNEAAVMAG
ncbi:MAG: chromosome segregation protein SMC [SAR324 cluster bacterium]|nr:chromosome segregation protein SMC [SAR324 cluster bacterium]